jgi:uncharacterized membrane protein
MARLSRYAGAGAVAALVLYPFGAYLSFRSFDAGWLAALLLVASFVRLAAARVSGAPLTPLVWLVPVVGVVLAAFSLLRSQPDAMLYYPALVSLAMFCLFGASVLFPPTVVERIARRMDGPLSPRAVRYTRRVTIAWLGFFVANGSAALYTALYTPLDIWALYNGFVAYLLIGAMFGGEWLIRRRVLAAERRKS